MKTSNAGGMQNRNFRPISRLVSERIEDSAIDTTERE